MMKFPSASAGGTTPSGSSLAVTYPGVFGSRVGGVGRGTGEVVCGGGVVAGGFCAVVAAATASRLTTSAMHERVVVMTERRRGVGYGMPTDGAPAPSDAPTPRDRRRASFKVPRPPAQGHRARLPEYLIDHTQAFVTQPITFSRYIPTPGTPACETERLLRPNAARVARF